MRLIYIWMYQVRVYQASMYQVQMYQVPGLEIQRIMNLQLSVRKNEKWSWSIASSGEVFLKYLIK